jgi:hypothetical protein
VDVQADDDPMFLSFITDIKTNLVLGVEYFEKTDVKLIFLSTISWPQSGTIHPYRHPARSVAGPTSCPKGRMERRDEGRK